MLTGFESFLGDVSGVIRWVDLYLLAVQNDLNSKISGMIDGTADFWDWAYVMTGTAIAMIAMYGAVSAGSWGTLAHTAIRRASTLVATFFDTIGLQFIIATHKFLIAVWLDYRNMFRGISTAAAGLSQTLGYTLEFIPTAMYNLQTMFTSVFTLFGYPPQQTEIIFLQSYAELLERWDSNFSRYARDPAMIFDDLTEWINIYALNQELGYGNNVADDISNINDTVQEKADQLLAVETAFNQLIMDLPEETFTPWQEWYAPIHDQIEDFNNEYIIPSFDYLNEIVGILEEKANRNAPTWAEYIESLANFPDILSGIFLDASEVGKWNKNLFSYLVNRAGVWSDKQIEDSVAARLEADINPPVIPFSSYKSPVLPDLPTTPIIPLTNPPPFTGNIYNGAALFNVESNENSILDACKGIII